MGIIRKSAASVKPGDQFGRWTVIGEPFSVPCGFVRLTFAVVECECGAVQVVAQHKLRQKKSRSCGCWRTELLVARFRIHGESQTVLYRMWHGMMSRCYKKGHESWRNYGGRGITVCREWHDFLIFKEWATEAGYRPGLSIERMENDGNYEPGNCKWETHVRQCRNTRKTVYLEAFGERKSLPDWAEDARCVVCSGTLRSRIKLGWEAEIAIKTSARDRN
jgi:hypothetical protein